MRTLYGIRNCDTVRKARRWLDRHAIDYRFHDFRVDGLERVTLARWVTAFGVDGVLNRRGRTWRDLPTSRRETDEAGLIALMLDQPTLIRRPVLEQDDGLEIGFDDAGYARRFGIDDAT